MYIDNTKIA